MSEHEDTQGADAAQADAARFDEAVRWHARLREPDAGEATRRAFAQWRLRDPRHAAAFAEAENLWGRLAAPAAAWARPAPRRPRRVVHALAASLMLAVLGAALWLGGGELDRLRADHHTVTGTQQTLTLADGSRVELNTDTALAVAFSDGERRVRLLRGEAFFEVTPDAARPFVVDTRDGRTRVVGTAFNLRLRDERTEISVAHGRVEISAAALPQLTRVLTPGEQGAIDAQGLGSQSDVDLAAITAWRQQRIVFYRAPLREVIAELDRYRRGRIVVLDPQLQALPVSGAFDLQQPDATLQLIEQALQLRHQHLTPLLTLLF